MVMMKVEMMVAVVVNANFSVRMNMFIWKGEGEQECECVRKWVWALGVLESVWVGVNENGAMENDIYVFIMQKEFWLLYIYFYI